MHDIIHVWSLKKIFTSLENATMITRDEEGVEEG